MSNILYSALSLISNLGKDNDFSVDKSFEITKENSYLIQGTFENINNIYGLLSKENNQSFFYSFSFSDEYKIIKNNKEITFNDLKEGDNITVTYNGNVTLVYPPKLDNVTRIEVLNK